MVFAPFTSEIYTSCWFMASRMRIALVYFCLFPSSNNIYVICNVVHRVAQLARCLYYCSRLIQASIIWFIIFPFSLVGFIESYIYIFDTLLYCCTIRNNANCCKSTKHHAPTQTSKNNVSKWKTTATIFVR